MRLALVCDDRLVSLRERLPQLTGDPFITDGGMETVLIFDYGLELPDFASFVLLDDPKGVEALRSYYEKFIDIARERGAGLVLDTPTWRANADWGERLGYSPEALADVNRRGVALLEEVRQDAGETELVISGCIGPRGDGYQVGDTMTPEEAEPYHEAQVDTLAGTAAELVSALTMTYVDEAIGIVRAAEKAAIPSVVSFTLETDGRLPSGQALKDAVAEVDAETGAAAAYFMVNCAHPTHFEDVLADGGLERVRGLRANASSKSHAELDEAEELDQGDPHELAEQYRSLRRLWPNLTVVGGCCGTDHRHVDEICAVWTG
jgi:S-methylmethionine-dependent homocysteine/selenocysteine methylase